MVKVGDDLRALDETSLPQRLQLPSQEVVEVFFFRGTAGGWPGECSASGFSLVLGLLVESERVSSFLSSAVPARVHPPTLRQNAFGARKHTSTRPESTEGT